MSMTPSDYRFSGVMLPATIWCAKLSPTGKILWGEIYLRDGQDGCTATEKELAEALGVTVKLIRAAVQRLATLGFIVKERRRKGRRRILRAVEPSRYNVDLGLPSGQSQTIPDYPQGNPGNSRITLRAIPNDPGLPSGQSGPVNGRAKKTDESVVSFSAETPSLLSSTSSLDTTPLYSEERDSQNPFSLFVAEFFRLHKLRTGAKPIMDGTQGKIIKTILKQQPLDIALTKLRRYYMDDSLWFTKEGTRSLSQFRFRYNDIPLEGAKNGGYHGKVSDATRQEWKLIFDNAESRSTKGTDDVQGNA